MQLTCWNSFEIKASCPDKTLVDYKLVIVLFTAYNVLPTEKYDDRGERLVWEIRTEKQNQRILKSQLCKNPLFSELLWFGLFLHNMGISRVLQNYCL